MPDFFRGIRLDPLVPANNEYLQWMILGYLVTSSVLVVSVGRLGDLFGWVALSCRCRLLVRYPSHSPSGAHNAREVAKRAFLRIAPFGSFAIGPVSRPHLIPVIQAW
jgi:hypothetical protein